MTIKPQDDALPELSDRLKIRSLEVRGAEGPLPARLYTLSLIHI